MNRRFFYLSLLSLSIAACSSSNNSKQAAGDFDYANDEEAKALIIPDDLDKPKPQNEFFISDKINKDGPVGKNVDVRAPSLVLPVAASSRVVPETGQAIIWFDKVLEDRDLKEYIHDALINELAEDNVTLTTVDTDKYESSWFHSETMSGMWLFEEVSKAQSYKFKYELEAKSHGRSVSVLVTLIDYMQTDEKGDSKYIDPIDKHRAEIAMLNKITEHVDFLYRKQQRANHLMRANQQIVTIGETPEFEPAYIIDMELELVWDNLPIFFESHGFRVTDLNETKHIYHVDFVKPDLSIWDRIWGDTRPVVEIEDAKYQFKLIEMGNQTALTIYDVDGFILNDEMLTKIFPVMEPGLSFRDL